MKNSIRSLTVLMLAVLCLFVSAVFAQGAETGTLLGSGSFDEDKEWTLTNDGVLTVTGTGSTGEYSFSPHPWSEALQPYYEDYYEDSDEVKNDFVKKIVIGEGITEIGKYSFEFMTGVTEVVLPESLTVIGTGAFQWCDALEKITLPEGLTKLGSNAFRHCVSLKKINIPDSLTGFGGAFTDCTALNLPKDLNSYCRASTQYSSYGYTGSEIKPAIRVYTQKGTRLKEGKNYTVTLENNVDYGTATVTVKGIGKYIGTKTLTFKIKPAKVKELVLAGTDGPSATVTWTSAIPADRYDVYLGSRLLGSTTSESYTVTDLGYNTTQVIKVCPVVTRVSSETGESVEYQGNKSTLEVKITPDGSGLLGSGSFGKDKTWTLSTDGVLTVSGSGSTGNYSFSAHPWSEALQPYYEKYFEETDEVKNDFVKKIVIGEGITEIGKYSFEFMTGVTEVVLPESLKTINTGAFQWCDALEKITLPEGLTKLGSNAFRHCVSLKKINIPDGLTNYSGAFTDCTSLTGLPKDIDSYCRVSTKYTSYGYTGKEIRPVVRVYTQKGTRLKEGKNYTVTYKNNVDYGTATVTVKGIGKYKGTKTLTFRIRPAKVRELTVTERTATSVSVTWKANPLAEKYKVFCGTKTYETTSTSFTVTGLKAGTYRAVTVIPVVTVIDPSTKTENEISGISAVVR